MSQHNAMRQFGSERGAAALVVAISLLVLMGFAALVVDVGAGFNERAQDQSAADASALGGVLTLALGGTSQASVNEVLNYVNNNIRTTDIPAWENCTDPGRLPLTAKDLGLTPATDCISFKTFSYIRVRVPDQQVATTFARLLGATTLNTHGIAEASGKQFPGLGSPPPFAVLAGYSAGDQVCLRTNSSGNPGPMKVGNGPGTDPDYTGPADPCDDSEYDVDSEMFGLLDPLLYFDENSQPACKQNARDYAIAAGIDHGISTFENSYVLGDSRTQQDGIGCKPAPVPGGNTLPLKTGLTAQELRSGLLTLKNTNDVDAGSGVSLQSPARLQQGDYYSTSSPTFVGEHMDNKALWEFLADPLPGGLPSACYDLEAAIAPPGDPTWDYYDKRDSLLDCLLAWNPNNDPPLFEKDVASSARLAWIPYLWEDTLDSAATGNVPTTCPGGAGIPASGECVHINDFVPVWLQTLYTKQNKANGCDDFYATGGGTKFGRHHAGQTNDCGSSNGNVDRLSAILLDCGMLPEAVCKARPGPPSSTPGGSVTPEIFLTK